MKTHRETATGETIFTHLDNIIIIIIWGFFAVFLPKKKNIFFSGKIKQTKTNRSRKMSLDTEEFEAEKTFLIERRQRH